MSAASATIFSPNPFKHTDDLLEPLGDAVNRSEKFDAFVKTINWIPCAKQGGEGLSEAGIIEEYNTNKDDWIKHLKNMLGELAATKKEAAAAAATAIAMAATEAVTEAEAKATTAANAVAEAEAKATTAANAVAEAEAAVAAATDANAKAEAERKAKEAREAAKKAATDVDVATKAVTDAAMAKKAATEAEAKAQAKAATAKKAATEAEAKAQAKAAAAKWQGAIVLLAFVAGEKPEVWKDILLKQANDEEISRDRRAIATLSLLFCDKEIGKSDPDWDELVTNGLFKLLEDDSLLVRRRAAQVLSRAARHGGFGRGTPKGCKEGEGSFWLRLKGDPDTYYEIEHKLIERWNAEIEDLVDEHLFTALIDTVGAKGLPIDRDYPWTFAKVVKQATKHIYPPIHDHVGSAVEHVIQRILKHNTDDSTSRARAVDKLYSLGEEAISADEFKGNYEAQRKVILAIQRTIADAIGETKGGATDAITRARVDVAEVAVKKGIETLAEIASNTGLANVEDLSRNPCLQSILALQDACKELKPKSELSTWCTNHLKCHLLNFHAMAVPVAMSILATHLPQQEASKYFVDELVVDAKSMYAKEDFVNAIAYTIRDHSDNTLKSAYEDVRNRFESSDEKEKQRAEKLLIAMGGEHAVRVGVRRQEVIDRFWTPMENLDKKGQELMSELQRNYAGKTFRFTRFVSLTAAIAGLALIIISILSTLIPCQAALDILTKNVMKLTGNFSCPDLSNNGLFSATGVLTGLVALVTGMLVPFFFNPASALNKSASEMSRLLTGFHSYVARLRLLGLGFAFSYTEKDWEQLNYLKSVSDAVGGATRDAGLLMSDIGKWPEAQSTTAAASSEQVQVPSLEAKSAADAFSEADKAGLKVKVTDMEYSEKDAGVVIQQSPEKDKKADKGSTISVTLSRGKDPELKDVPDVVKKSYEDAVALIVETGLKSRHEKRPSAQDDLEKVIEQSPPKETKLAKGGHVLVIVGSGPITVDNFADKQLTAALVALFNKGLKPEITLQYDASKDAGVVIAQEPSAGASVDKGAGVKLTVRHGKQ